jgi:hypothetical protein
MEISSTVDGLEFDGGGVSISVVSGGKLENRGANKYVSDLR